MSLLLCLLIMIGLCSSIESLEDTLRQLYNKYGKVIEEADLSYDESIQIFTQLIELNVLNDFHNEGLNFIQGGKYKKYINAYF